MLWAALLAQRLHLLFQLCICCKVAQLLVFILVELLELCMWQDVQLWRTVGAEGQQGLVEYMPRRCATPCEAASWRLALHRAATCSDPGINARGTVLTGEHQSVLYRDGNLR